MSATYSSLLRLPGAAAFSLTGAVGRVGIAMTSLGLIWLIHERTGSYAVAGLVTGTFAVAEGVVGPQVARLIDHGGQTRVLPPLLLLHASAVVALLTMLTTSHPPTWALTLGGLGMGASIPQLAALTGARWAALLRRSHPELLPTAFSLESLANGSAFLLGPVLVALIGASGHPALGTGLAAAFIVMGGGALAGQRRTAPTSQPRSERPSGAGRLLRPTFLRIVALNGAIGVYFGSLQVSVTAFAVEHGAAGSAAGLFAVSSVAGLLAGWLFGLRTWRLRPTTQLVWATTGLAVFCLLLITPTSVWGLGVGLALTGMTIPPILVIAAVLTERDVHPSALTQAFTWLNSASAAGAAVAASAVGLTVDAFSARGGFVIAAVAAALMAVIAALGHQAFSDVG